MDGEKLPYVFYSKGVICGGVRHFTCVIFWESLSYAEDSIKLEEQKKKVGGNKFYGVKRPQQCVFLQKQQRQG